MRSNKVNVLKKMLGMLLVAPVMLSLSLFAANPVHHWKLDETAGSTFEDTGTIGDANGTCTSPDGCPSPSDGQIYGAQSFDGNDTIDVNGTAFNWTADANATIEFWMKSSSTVSGAGGDVMIGRYDNGSVLWYVAVSVEGYIRAQINDGYFGSGNIGDGVSSPNNTQINDGNWNHIAYVVKPGQVRVFVNGENDFNITRTATDLSADTNVTIGNLDPNPGREYTGQLDDIKLYATDLNGSTIKAHYMDGFKPHLLEVTPVPTGTDGSDLKYTFSSDKNGTITYIGLCDSLDMNAIDGNNTITFDPLPSGTYDDCNITVTSTEADSDGNVSDPLAVSSFVVGTTVPAPEPAPTTSGGGGGCTYNPDSKHFDMVFLLMIALGLFYPFRRRFIK